MSNKKQFATFFLIAFVIFTIALMPVRFTLGKVGETRIFGGNESIMDQMDYIVDKSGPYYDLFSKSDRVNILVLGDNDGLTDTIMLASYDLKNQRLDIISVPRDTYYLRKGYKGAAAQKINAIYGSEGVIGTAKAVSDTLLGMPINYYAVIEFSDVEKIVNKIGGVPMDIPFTMKYNDPYDKPPLHIYIEKGQQTLDGKKAVQFLRYRHGYPEGDIGRVKAQQEFIKSAMKQAIGPELPGVVKLGLEEIESDITLGTATKIATKAIGLDPQNISTYLAPGGPKTVNKASYWFVDTEKTGEMVEQIYKPVTEDASKNTEDAE
ncbi:LCP family protein [Aminipila luticellarii]|nr:LCP family protein [Aminipila luticellarii]